MRASVLLLVVALVLSATAAAFANSLKDAATVNADEANADDAVGDLLLHVCRPPSTRPQSQPLLPQSRLPFIVPYRRRHSAAFFTCRAPLSLGRLCC